MAGGQRLDYRCIVGDGNELDVETDVCEPLSRVENGVMLDRIRYVDSHTGGEPTRLVLTRAAAQ